MVERSISRSRGLLCDESQNLYRLLPSADIWSYAQRMYLRPTNMQTKLHRILFQFISFYLFVSLTCRVRMRGRAPTVRPTEFQTCLRSAWRWVRAPILVYNPARTTVRASEGRGRKGMGGGRGDAPISYAIPDPCPSTHRINLEGIGRAAQQGIRSSLFQ